ncbi:MAG: hypothetical protein ACE3JQ_07975 [Paenisporosarcina sp.]
MKFYYLHNQNGILLPAALILLFVVSGLLIVFMSAYLSQTSMYELLENYYISATIVQMENQ